jgi:simple sugar transport system ATP-binding protein
MHQRQLLQLACALASKPGLLLLDEPTAVMSQADTHNFWNLIQCEVENGLTVVIATHKLEDITAYCSHVTVMRAGRLVFTRSVEDVSLEDIIIGMAPVSNSDNHSKGTCDKVLGAKSVVRITGNGASLTIHEHEVHGIAGLDGSCYATWLAALALGQQEGLSVTVNDINIDSLSISDRRNIGIGYIPSDRLKDALVSTESLEVNMSFGQLPSSKSALWMPISRSKGISAADAIVEKYDVRPRDSSRLINTLSGGNQQKFIVGRELERKNHVMVVDQPTRGLDRTATRGVSQKIQAASMSEKTALLVYSDDLTFLIDTCDTISVVSRGHLVESRPVSQWTEALLVEAMI